MNRTALVIGGTGLVGFELLKLLKIDAFYSKVIVVSRRPVELDDAKMQSIVTDFNYLEDVAEQMKADHYFCCLGTTMKKAGSKENFMRVDYEYPLTLAKIASHHQAINFQLVSALGANRSSSFFYNKVKGQVEDDIRALNLNSLNIFRPSLLLGDRNESRKGEEFAKIVTGFMSPIMIGHFKKYKPVVATNVAVKMIRVAKREEPGVEIFESNEINKL